MTTVSVTVATSAISPKKRLTLVRRRIGRAPGHECQCGRRSPLPVRHQGEEGTPPGQREQPHHRDASVTAAARMCAISVTNDQRRWSGLLGARLCRTVHSLLFIEDDDQIRLALTMALEDEGYQVREAPDGASGLAAFAEREADLVLLDLRLPDMSGFDVCRALRAREHRADHHHHGPDRHLRPGRRARGGGRRLHHQAGRPQGAGGPDPGAAAAGAAAGVVVGAAGDRASATSSCAASRASCSRPAARSA